MSKKLLLASLISMLLAGCNQDGIEVGGPETGTGPDAGGGTPPPVTTKYIGSLLVSGMMITGDVLCNGESLDAGKFEVEQDTTFTCNFGGVVLGEFTAPLPTKTTEPTAVSFDLKSIHGENASRVLQTINDCPNSNTICLDELNSFDIQDIYTNISDSNAVDQFVSAKDEDATTDTVGEAPSSHVDNDIVPAVTPGANKPLGSDGFVAANAEAALEYKPSAESKVLTASVLTDADGKPIQGIQYFSTNSVGITNELGQFEYLWGDTLTFGIDTFTFGSVKGNQIDYKITDVTSNKVEKDNIQALLTRYATVSATNLVIDKEVYETFALYPNVINGLINLSLPNGGKLEDTEFSLPNEFEGQFDNGLTSIIDGVLNNKTSYSFDAVNVYSSPSDTTYVTDSLNAIFTDVKTFHVFHDNYGYYGATGFARGMRTLNMSNRAFPVMMPRNDINRLIPFGERQAWTREGKPYVAEFSGINVVEIPKVSGDTATYNFPFVTAGEVGKGNVVFMGNSMYPSILSCPDNYWANSHNELRPNGTTEECITGVTKSDARYDNGDMKRFFANLFEWFTVNMEQSSKVVGTNIERGMIGVANVPGGYEYDFFISSDFGFESVAKIASGGFDDLKPEDMPILILQAYGVHKGEENNSANINDPKLSQDDVTALIKYINKGGNVLFMDAISEVNPEPIGRIADAAGVSLGGQNVTPTSQANCGSSSWCDGKPNVQVKNTSEIVVLQRYDDMAGGTPPFTVNQDGTTTWAPADAMFGLSLYIPTYDVTSADGKVTTKHALIRVENIDQRAAAIKELEAEFKDTPVCKNAYEYEFNCIEVRSGTGIAERGAQGRPDFARYDVDVKSMVKAANVGSNVKRLAEHELYYRSEGKQGTRLSTVDLNQTYDNLSVWLWNDNQYAFVDIDEETGQPVPDELGFETLVQYLNCYTDGKHGSGASCPPELKTTLVENGMIHDGELAGQMNPSYPLNYMEKPLTRIMLGRSFWDYDITVDTSAYPTRPAAGGTSATVNITDSGKGVTYSAGNMQSTGLWAKQLEEITVTGGSNATITVMLADDLTGLPKHETRLNRPPRMQMSFNHTEGSTTKIKTPYGGLIYVQPNGIGGDFEFSNVVQGAVWKDGAWKTSPSQTEVGIAEVHSETFIYTTPRQNVVGMDDDAIIKFTDEMDRFADAASDFYGRDQATEEGIHRRFTYKALTDYKHRYVNDVQISIGDAHSGYPIMSNGFNVNADAIPTAALDDWLLWHEAGHNVASAPFNVTGSTEVTNNILALYMQELEGRHGDSDKKPTMDRISTSIQKAPIWLRKNTGHAWSHGDAGLRLVMFGQLKVWAEDNFDIGPWYKDAKPKIYNEDQGWNLFKLMHRKARGGDEVSPKGITTNYCSSATGLSNGDLLMACASYATGYDLSDFFNAWNVGETSMTTPTKEKVYSGGITQAGLDKVKSMDLKKPVKNPLTINALPN